MLAMNDIMILDDSFTNKLSYYFHETVIMSVVWIPIVFAAFAIGQRKVGLRFLFALITTEAVACYLSQLVRNGAWLF
jgi:hypothetical protein